MVHTESVIHLNNIAEHYPLLIVGITIIISLYAGKLIKFTKLPSLIGYMLIGIILGPSLFNLIGEHTQENLSFITEIALGFVALGIGLELSFGSLQKLGKSIIYVIFLECFAAFGLVFAAVYFITKNIPLALIFASIAPASAPAGTVAIIQEYKAKGNLTKALYAIVGFDDGLGIIIFGFAFAIAKNLLIKETGTMTSSLGKLLLPPLQEVGLSIFFGIVIAIVFSFLLNKLKKDSDMFVIIFAFVLTLCGISAMFHLSLILTNMIVGLVIVNTQKHSLVERIHDKLPSLMHLLFVLFFTLAGTNLHIDALPALGGLGLAYILARSGGLIFGSKLGAIIGKANDNIRKYVGLGILSQAGVAIGLSLIVKHEFKGLGKVLNTATGMTSGDKIGAMVITTVTATCIFFEVIGPILTKYALTKAGDIKVES